VRVWRLDCGTIQVNDLNVFSDTDAYPGQSKTLVDSCYLLRHGARYMLWDAGLPATLIGQPLSREGAMSATASVSIVDQLAKIGVKPSDVTLLGISHYHFDHIGQAASFPTAKLLIGKRDLDAISAKPADPRLQPEALAPWIEGDAPKEAVVGDRDVFGDGSVRMLALPGHTPDHRALLVTLRSGRRLMLTGDLYHFREQVAHQGVPDFNTDRADTLASMDRFQKLARNLKAEIIIQHEPGHVAKLPAFPAFAE